MRSTFFFRGELRAGEEPHNPGNLEPTIIVKFWGYHNLLGTTYFRSQQF